jgi:MFS family permease
MVPLALVIRDAPAEPAAPASPGPRQAPEPDLALIEIGRTPQFWIIALTHFTCCVAHSGPIFHMVANATDHGVAQMAAATLVALLSLQAPAILLYVFARETASFYAIALVFGVAYGGVMPLYALLTRESFGARAMGGAYGAIYMLQAIGMGLGAFAGGWLYDRLGGYGWSFATAAAIGASAVLVALMLRARVRARRPVVAGLSRLTP